MVTTNLGDTAGLVVASALMVDYVLTVAVSTASAMSNIGSARPDRGREQGVVLRGRHRAGDGVEPARDPRVRGWPSRSRPTRSSSASSCMIGWGLIRIYVLGNPLRAESAGFQMQAEHGQIVGFAFAFLMARSFSSGCAALTGVEAISNGVPAFRETQVAQRRNDTADAGRNRGGPADGHHRAGPADRRAAGRGSRDAAGRRPGRATTRRHWSPSWRETVFGSFHIGFLLITAVTALILVLAANTAFNGFPVLGSVLAQHSYLPRQLHTRGDRLAFSNGILFLSAAALAFVIAFRGEVTALIQLYIVGVFISFTLSQIGMVRHWTRLLRTETDPQGAEQDDALAGGQHRRLACPPARFCWSCWSPNSLPGRGSPSSR